MPDHSVAEGIDKSIDSLGRTQRTVAVTRHQEIQSLALGLVLLTLSGCNPVYHVHVEPPDYSKNPECPPVDENTIWTLIREFETTPGVYSAFVAAVDMLIVYSNNCIVSITFTVLDGVTESQAKQLGNDLALRAKAMIEDPEKIYSYSVGINTRDGAALASGIMDPPLRTISWYTDQPRTDP